MLVIGADLGTQQKKTVFVLVDTDTNPPTLLDVQAVEVSNGVNWFARVGEIASRFAEWLDSLVLKPEGFGVEGAFLGKNPSIALSLATLGGVLIGVALAKGIMSTRVHHTQAKVALVGRGAATKQDMQIMAERLFGREFDEDTADAIGVGLAGEAAIRLFLQTGVGDVIV